MLEIVDKRDMEGDKSISVHDIPIGTIFYGEVRTNAGNTYAGLYARGNRAILRLDDLNFERWYTSAYIYNYQPVEAELHVLENLDE